MKTRSLFLGLVLLLLATGLFHVWFAIGPKADALWLHYIGYRWFEPERAMAAESAHRLSGAYEGLEMARREVVFRNYPVAAVTQYAFHRLSHLPIAIGAGLLLQYLVAVFLFVLALARIRDTIPLCLVLATVALTAVLPGPRPTDHLLLYSGFEAVANFIAVIVAPGEAFNPMSPWPKNIVLLLALAAFSLRWQGERRASYILCLCMVPFHVSFGLIVFCILCALDVAGRFIPRLQGTNGDAFLVTSGCVIGGLSGIAIYLILNPPMPWDVPSAFVQLATRLFVLATLVILLWLATKATIWLRSRLGSDSLIIANAVVWIVSFMMTYAAIGELWQRSKMISAGYERLADPAVAPRDMQRVYFDILTELRRGG
jgi:hypothetical protein